MGCINQNSNRNQSSDKIILKIDSKEALVNGETKELDVPATIVNEGHLYL